MQKQHVESVAAKKAADPVTLSVGTAATGPQEAILPPWLLPNTLAEYIMPVIERQDATVLDAAWRSESGLVIAELMNNFAQWIKETKLSLASISSIEKDGGSNVGGYYKEILATLLRLFGIIEKSPIESATKNSHLLYLFDRAVDAWLYASMYDENASMLPASVLAKITNINSVQLSLNTVLAFECLQGFQLSKMRKHTTILQEYWQLPNSSSADNTRGKLVYSMALVVESPMHYFSFAVALIAASLDNFRNISPRTALHATFTLLRVSSGNLNSIVMRKFGMCSVLTSVWIREWVKFARLRALLLTANQAITIGHAVPCTDDAVKLLPAYFVDTRTTPAVEDNGKRNSEGAETVETEVEVTAEDVEKERAEQEKKRDLQLHQSHDYRLRSAQDMSAVFLTQLGAAGSISSKTSILLSLYFLFSTAAELKLTANHESNIDALVNFFKQEPSMENELKLSVEVVLSYFKAQFSLRQEIEKVRQSKLTSSGQAMNLTELSHASVELGEATAVPCIRSLQSVLKTGASAPITTELESKIRYHVGLAMWLAGSNSKLRKDKTVGSVASLLAAAKLAAAANEDDTDIFALIAHTYLQENDVVRAEKCYVRVLQANPLHTEAGLGLCQLYLQQQNNSPKLQALLDKYTHKNAKDDEVFPVWWADVIQAHLHTQQGAHDSASIHYQRALELCPQDSSSWLALGMSYLYAGRDSAAHKALLQAVALSAKFASFDVNMHLALANLERKMSLLIESKRRYEQVIAHLTTADCRQSSIQALAAKGLADVCLLLAYQHLSCGWIGGAATVIAQGVTALNSVVTSYLEDQNQQEMLIVCLKLLGDLYCFTHNLTPFEVQQAFGPNKNIETKAMKGVSFSEMLTSDSSSALSEEGFELMITYLERGEAVYQRRLALLQAQLQEAATNSAELVLLISAAHADIGVCRYCQACLRLRMRGEGSGLLSTSQLVKLDSSKQTKNSVPALFASARESFLAGIKVNAASSICWNGLGICTNLDQLSIKQACFVRATQIDSNAAAYNNLAVLLLSMGRRHEANDCLAELQHRDNNPLTWLTIAFDIERSSSSNKQGTDTFHFAQSALDAYLSASDITRPVEGALGSAVSWLQLNGILVNNQLRSQFGGVCDGEPVIVDCVQLRHQVINKLQYYLRSKPVNTLAWLLLAHAYELCANFVCAQQCLEQALGCLSGSLRGCVCAEDESKRIVRAVQSIIVSYYRCGQLQVLTCKQATVGSGSSSDRMNALVSKYGGSIATSIRGGIDLQQCITQCVDGFCGASCFHPNNSSNGKDVINTAIHMLSSTGGLNDSVIEGIRAIVCTQAPNRHGCNSFYRLIQLLHRREAHSALTSIAGMIVPLAAGENSDDASKTVLQTLVTDRLHGPEILSIVCTSLLQQDTEALNLCVQLTAFGCKLFPDNALLWYLRAQAKWQLFASTAASRKGTKASRKQQRPVYDDQLITALLCSLQALDLCTQLLRAPRVDTSKFCEQLSPLEKHNYFTGLVVPFSELYCRSVSVLATIRAWCNNSNPATDEADDSKLGTSMSVLDMLVDVCLGDGSTCPAALMELINGSKKTNTGGNVKTEELLLWKLSSVLATDESSTAASLTSTASTNSEVTPKLRRQLKGCFAQTWLVEKLTVRSLYLRASHLNPSSVHLDMTLVNQL
jgi:tetratricopeptide (TPR) repeat protein